VASTMRAAPRRPTHETSRRSREFSLLRTVTSDTAGRVGGEHEEECDGYISDADGQQLRRKHLQTKCEKHRDLHQPDNAVVKPPHEASPVEQNPNSPTPLPRGTPPESVPSRSRQAIGKQRQRESHRRVQAFVLEIQAIDGKTQYSPHEVTGECTDCDLLNEPEAETAKAKAR
jgi:hypothetical protein